MPPCMQGTSARTTRYLCMIYIGGGGQGGAGNYLWVGREPGHATQSFGVGALQSSGLNKVSHNLCI